METAASLSIIEVLGIAGSVSLLAGWRLYLVVLATGHSARDTWATLVEQGLPIEAKRENDHPLVVSYPLLSGSPKVRVLLEMLAELGLLRRREFDQAKICGHCGSTHLEFGEQCPQCRSNLAPIIHDSQRIGTRRAGLAGLTAVFRGGFSERLGVDVRGSSGGTCRPG